MTMAGSSPQNFKSEPTPSTQTLFDRWRQLLPMSFQHTRAPTITCYDNLGNAKTHGLEQRYVSPTTGVCRKLVIQSVHPRAPNERPISDNTGHVSKLALWLMSTNPFRGREFFIWTGTWLVFEVKLLWYFLWLCAQLVAQLFFIDLPEDSTDDAEPYNTGYYKPYVRDFSGQLWEARSKMEYSSRVKGEDEKERCIITRSLHPRLIIIHDPSRNEWVRCTDPSIIKKKKYLAISFRAADVYTPGPDEQREKEQFKQEVRLVTLQQHYDAYWLDLECIGDTPDEKNLDVYCMADVYRGAESTLIMLGKSSEGEEAVWERWGGRVWTFPEALLSQRLLYKYRDRDEINSVTLHQLANLAYPKHASEQAVINAYSGRDPLERLERLSRLKSAIWARGISVASKPSPMPIESIPFQPFPGSSTLQKNPPRSGPHAAERVYALMGFFDHRIQPNYGESELKALARLSIANDSDRIAERMVSLLPSEPHPDACWYADDDIYGADLWDILPEIQVAGVTDGGALVVDGCRAACIRWKDFPQISFDKTSSVRRTVLAFIPYLAWPILVVGIVLVLMTISVKGGVALAVIGIALLLASPRLFVISEAGRVLDPQPWFIGVRGVLHVDVAAKHLYGGGNKGRYRRIDYTPSGSKFAVPGQGAVREGADEQYDKAKLAEEQGIPMYTVVDTYAGAVYYFTAERPPTVCLFTGREGGLGRFVLCSERCSVGELHKETVLRMPTEISQRMEMCGWVALG